jgi:hypothetical protein
MSDETNNLPEPERDATIAAALADAFGETPRDVDFAALAARTRAAAAFRLRGRARTRRAPWWETAGQWSRRALPIGALAAAAALVLAALTPRSSESSLAEESDAVSAAVVSSATPAQAARQVASGTLDESWLWNAAVGTTEEQQ